MRLTQIIRILNNFPVDSQLTKLQRRGTNEDALRDQKELAKLTNDILQIIWILKIMRSTQVIRILKIMSSMQIIRILKIMRSTQVIWILKIMHSTQIIQILKITEYVG